MYIRMTYSVVRWYQLSKKKPCEIHIFIILTHIVSPLVQYLLILNVIIRSIPSCKNMALLAPDNIFISHHEYFPHEYQLFLGRACTFLLGSMPYTLKFPFIHESKQNSLVNPAWLHSWSLHLAVEILTQEKPIQIQGLPPQDQHVGSVLFNFHPNSRSRRVQNGKFSPQLQGALKWKCLGYLSDLLYMRFVERPQIKGHIIHVPNRVVFDTNVFASILVC